MMIVSSRAKLIPERMKLYGTIATRLNYMEQLQHT